MRKLCIPVLALAVMASAAAARADVITPDGSAVVNSVPPPGNDGYVFFDTSSGDLTNLPSYASVTNDGSPYAGGTTLTVNGVGYTSGTTYLSSYNSSKVLATITLTGTVPGSFRIGLLSDNAQATQDSTAFTLTSSSLGSATLNSPVDGFDNTNNFFFATVTGATAGETITVSGTAAISASLGGITFDAAPEPATLGILGLGAIGLLGRKRRKA